jgi:hypothetical protein
MPTMLPHAGHGALNDEDEAVLRDWPIPWLAPVAGTALVVASSNRGDLDVRHDRKPAGAAAIRPFHVDIPTRLSTTCAVASKPPGV